MDILPQLFTRKIDEFSERVIRLAKEGNSVRVQNLIQEEDRKRFLDHVKAHKDLAAEPNGRFGFILHQVEREEDEEA